MQSPTQTACMHPSIPATLPSPRQAECVYRGITLVAMLLLLASLWVF